MFCPKCGNSVGDEFNFCFNCGFKGDIVSYVMKLNQVKYAEAVEELAVFAGVDIASLKSINRDDLMRDAAMYYHQQLRENSKAKNAIDVLHSWGLKGKMIVKLGIGFKDDSSYNFKEYMTTEKGYTVDELIDCRLLGRNEKGNVYEKMRNSIIVPTVDEKGKVVAFDAYMLDKGEFFRYPNTDFFERAKSLYSYNLAIASGKKSVIVVSSYENYFKLFSKGITNAVATVFPRVTEDQMLLFEKKFKAVLFLTHHHSNLNNFKIFCRKNNMYCEQFNVDFDKSVIDYIEENADTIKEKVENIEQALANTEAT